MALNKIWDKMSTSRNLRRKAEREKGKKPLTGTGPVGSSLLPSQRMNTSEFVADRSVVSGGNGALRISKNKGDTVSVTIDSKHLHPPEKNYVPDSFTIETFIGYSDLYFGKKSPKGRSGDLLNCLAVRFPNNGLKTLVLKGQKDFYEKLQRQAPITEELKKQYGIILEEQFPVSQGSQHFVYSNFIYAAHGADVGELMFYMISPAYIHHMSSGQSAILAPDTKGIEGVITMTIPIDLLSYFYYKISENKNEY